MAKPKKAFQQSLLSCFKVAKRPYVRAKANRSSEKPAPRVNSSKNNKISIKSKSSIISRKFNNPSKIILKSTRQVITRSKSKEAVKKRVKKAGRKSQNIINKEATLNNMSIYDFTLSSRETDVNSEAFNKTTKKQGRAILTKDIEIEIPSVHSQNISKILKRGRNHPKDVSNEAKRRKISKGRESKMNNINHTILELKSNASTLSLNKSLLPFQEELKGGIPKMK